MLLMVGRGGNIDVTSGDIGAGARSEHLHYL